MFTGLIQKVGHLDRIERVESGTRLHLVHDAWDTSVVRGESVAVNGVCLTVASVDETGFWCDVLDQTLGQSAFKEKRAGSRVNLERALRVGDRLGGHMVTGHVDGTGRVQGLRRAGRDWVMTVSCSQDLLKGMVLRGSVSCDGVSLTLTRLRPESFDVWLIPTTWNDTALSDLRIGETVNLENDMLGKYVRRAVGCLTDEHGLDMERLQQAGFA